jgi:hypothetical protein
MTLMATYVVRPLLETPEVKTAIQTTKRDAKEISDKLVGFEDAWHMIRLASTHLLQNVELAETVLVCVLYRNHGRTDSQTIPTT